MDRHLDVRLSEPHRQTPAPEPFLKPPSSIVAIHGLGGDAITTWTHPKSKAFWLKDFLPGHMSDARILTFGYNAAAAFGRSTAEVIDHAKSLLASLLDKRDEDEEKQRPLIFVAHSLGGIVVKEALLQARIDPLYRSICDVTLGIVFFGTPHRGSDKAAYGKVLADVARTVLHQPRSNLVKALQTNSDVLLRLTSDFRHQLPQYRIFSFYELQPMSIFSNLIVDKHSALLDIQGEEQIPVEANHSAMCKFEREDDSTFEKLYKRLQRMSRESRVGLTRGETVVVSHNKHFEVPPLVSPVFTGRKEMCQRLEAAFTGRQARQQVQRRFVLYGMGGSGKTQICLKYAQDQRESYWGVFLVDASSSDSIQQSFLQISYALGVEAIADPSGVSSVIHGVKRKLANMTHSWLLIFDNADDPQLSLTPYFPAGGSGDVIVTSRNPGHSQYNTVGSQEVEAMSVQDAIDLFVKVAYSAARNHEETDSRHQQLVETLGCLALAVAQAGAYVRETFCSIEDYLELFVRRRTELMQYRPTHTGTDYKFTVYTTWQASLEAIESHGDVASNRALELFKLLCFYHFDRVPLEMFYNAWHNLRKDLIVPNSNVEYEHTADSDYRQLMRASTTLLASFSLITRERDDFLSLHPLVHDWCADTLSQAEHDRYRERARSLLVYSIPGENTTKDYSFRRSLVSHVYSCLRSDNLSGSDVGMTISYELSAMALVLRENGMTLDAIGLQERVLKAQKSKSGEDHPDTLDSMQTLAIYYSEAGRRTEALQLTEQVVQLRKSKQGEDYPDTLTLMHNLAVHYSEAGRRMEALQLTEQVVQLRKSKLGEDHPDTLTSMHNLAIRYSEAGRQTEALQLTEQVVQLRKSKLGEDHPNTLASVHSLAVYYSEAGRWMEALQLTEQVVQLRKSKLGEDHPDTLTSMHNLAIRYSEAGRQTEALQLTEQAVQLRKSKLGEDHPDTLDSMHNLAVYYSEARRWMEALQLTEQVVQLRKSKLGEDHPDTLASVHNLANRYSEAGRWMEALQLTEQVVQLRKSKLGEDHPDTLNSMHNLAFRYSEAGRRTEALQLTEQVVQLRKSKLGEDHPGTLKSLKMFDFISAQQTPSEQNPTEQTFPKKRSSIFRQLFRPSQNQQQKSTASGRLLIEDK